MGKYDYENKPIINTNYIVAIKQLDDFIAKENINNDFYISNI